MRPKPYIGVTGFMTRSEVQHALHALPANPSHKLMVGVLLSNTTLKGLSNSWPNRYPAGEAIRKIFVKHPHALNLFHYNSNQADDGIVLSDLLFAQNFPRSDCQGFQLNMCWPSPKILSGYKAQQDFNQNFVVLQCGRAALEAVGNSGRALASRVEEYLGLIDYVLIDASGSLGKDFDLSLAHECFDYLSDLPNISVVIAGGLHAQKIGRLRILKNAHPGLSIDAEGTLRDDHDNLDLPKVTRYISAALRVLR